MRSLAPLRRASLTPMLAMMMLFGAAPFGQAGQVNVLNPGGVTGILPPSPPVTPPSVTAPPAAPGPQGTVTLPGSDGRGEAPILGSANLSSRQAALLSQLQSLSLDGLTTSDLQVVLLALQRQLASLGEAHPLQTALQAEVARVRTELAAR